MKFRLLVITLFSLCIACNGMDYQLPEYEKIANRLTLRTVLKIEKETGLSLIGVGGGMMDDIQEMMIAFQYRQEVDFDTGRRLLVHAAEEYLKAINSSEEVRPYLHEYPFTNVEVEIYFVKPNGSYVSPGVLSIIALREGQVIYSIDDKETDRLIDIREEPYAEALRIVNSTPEHETQQDDGKGCL
jgi:hypothetical protein